MKRSIWCILGFHKPKRASFYTDGHSFVSCDRPHCHWPYL